MITLYSYPELSGVADNNGYGLKVFAFLRLAGVDFTQEHVFDASSAPRGQLPYIVDDAEEIGDSDTIIAHLILKYRLRIDDGLTPGQRDTNHQILRMKLGCARRKNSIPSDTFIKASAAIHQPRRTRGDSQICKC